VSHIAKDPSTRAELARDYGVVDSLAVIATGSTPWSLRGPSASVILKLVGHDDEDPHVRSLMADEVLQGYLLPMIRAAVGRHRGVDGTFPALNITSVASTIVTSPVHSQYFFLADGVPLLLEAINAKSVDTTTERDDDGRRHAFDALFKMLTQHGSRGRIGPTLGSPLWKQSGLSERAFALRSHHNCGLRVSALRVLHLLHPIVVLLLQKAAVILERSKSLPVDIWWNHVVPFVVPDALGILEAASAELWGSRSQEELQGDVSMIN